MRIHQIGLLICFWLRSRLLRLRINECKRRVAHRDFIAQRATITRIFDDIRQRLPSDRSHERRLMQVMGTVVIVQMQRAQTVAVFLQQRKLLFRRSFKDIAVAGIISEIDNGRRIA